MNIAANFPRFAEHPVADMFLSRVSTRAFAPTPISEGLLLSLLEAARWAPSGANNQPTRLVWARRGEAGFDALAQSLAEGNRVWAEKAAALVLVASKDTVDRNGETRPNPSAAFDAGAAWMSLALQAHLSGLVAHAMGGFDKAQALRAGGLVEGHSAHVIVAVGHPGDPASLPETLRARETPSTRLDLGTIAAHGSFAA